MIAWAVRVGGAVVAIWGGLLLAIYGAFLTPVRVGTVLVPVSVVLAIAGNAVLAWFAYHTTNSRVVGVLPGVVWVIVSFVWSTPTREGDLVLVNTWVSTLYLFLGVAPTVVFAYRWFAPRPTALGGSMT